MKRATLITFILILTCVAHAQVKTIKGRAMESNYPICNAPFKVENRNITGKTDNNGYFILKNVTDDDIIIFDQYYSVPRIISVKTATIEVLEEKEEPIASSLLHSRTSTLGVKIITDDRYKSQPYDWDAISKIKKHGGNKYSISNLGQKEIYTGSKVYLTSFVGFSTIGRMPKLQSEYAQGQGGQWQGADKNEIFSWGPKIDNLEFSGTEYPYDKNGSLVAKGSGNGIGAIRYDSKDFFRTGFTYGNTLDMKFPFFGNNTTTISLGQRRNDSPIPNAHSEQLNASLTVENIRTGKFNSRAGVLYKNSYDRLTQQGANLASLMHSVIITPPTFDNANGLSRKQALRSGESYDYRRSYAPKYANNPFMLVNQLPDRVKSNQLISYLGTKYSSGGFNASATVNFDTQRDRSYNGIMKYPSNHDSYKRFDESNYMVATSADYEFKIGSYNDRRLTVTFDYGFKKTDNEISRNDSYIYQTTNGVRKFDKKLSRNAQDIRYGAKFRNRYSDLNISVANKHYFSNTLKSSDYINLFPEIGANWNMRQLIYNLFDRNPSYFVLYGQIQRSVAESPLVANNPAVLSTTLKAEDFRGYYEYADILHHKGLKPETFLKSEFGFRYSTSPSYSNSFDMEGNMFYNNTQNFIAPNVDANTLEATQDNIGRLRNYGYFVSGNYYKYFHSKFNISARLNFSQTWNKVSAVYGGKEFVKLSGFSDISSVFAKNESLGAIYGSTYLRNQDGQVVIGADGFPLVDNVLKKIGDPTPDFRVTLMPTLHWQNFDFLFSLEYSHGGDRWNGTQAFLDYHGMSGNTALNRNITGHIFNGVDANGNTNVKPVDFYNPNRPLSENRWVRYGAAGVGAEYIEDASYLRLANISLTYTILNRGERDNKRSLKVGASIQNLFTVTSYKGADPASTLFGYSSGSGLDLFNQPSIRSYSFTVTLEL